MPPWVIDYINRLLRNYVIRAGTSYSLPYLVLRANAMHTRCNYVLKVLRASAEIRNSIMYGCEESDEVGQRALMQILVLWDTFSLHDREKFILNYKRVYSLKGLGLLEVGMDHVWEPTHIPPIIPP